MFDRAPNTPLNRFVFCLERAVVGCADLSAGFLQKFPQAPSPGSHISVSENTMRSRRSARLYSRFHQSAPPVSSSVSGSGSWLLRRSFVCSQNTARARQRPKSSKRPVEGVLIAQEPKEVQSEAVLKVRLGFEPLQVLEKLR